MSIIKSKHIFGSEADIDSALESGLIDAYDILFLEEGNVGWIDSDGNKYISKSDKNVDLSGYAKITDIPTKPEDIGAQPQGNYVLLEDAYPMVPKRTAPGKFVTVSRVNEYGEAAAFNSIDLLIEHTSPATEILPERTFAIDEMTDSGWVVSEYIPELIVGEIYTVIWDGQTFECEAEELFEEEMDAVYIGNKFINGGPYSDEPFAIIRFPVELVDIFGGYLTVLPVDDSGNVTTATVSISGKIKEYKIAEKYLPDSSGNIDEVYILSDGETIDDVPDGVELVIDPDGDPDFDLSGYVKTVNGIVPDENGNVEIAVNNSGNGSGGNVDFKTDETLTLKNGILSVNTTNNMEQDNTLPITSAGVFAAVGNIEALLKTI